MIYGHVTFYKSYSRLININKRNTENKQMDRQKYRLKPVRKSSKTCCKNIVYLSVSYFYGAMNSLTIS